MAFQRVKRSTKSIVEKTNLIHFNKRKYNNDEEKLN